MTGPKDDAFRGVGDRAGPAGVCVCVINLGKSKSSREDYRNTGGPRTTSGGSRLSV